MYTYIYIYIRYNTYMYIYIYIPKSTERPVTERPSNTRLSHLKNRLTPPVPWPPPHSWTQGFLGHGSCWLLLLLGVIKNGWLRKMDHLQVVFL